MNTNEPTEPARKLALSIKQLLKRTKDGDDAVRLEAQREINRLGQRS